MSQRSSRDKPRTLETKRYAAAAGWTGLRFGEHKQPENAMRLVVEAHTEAGPRLPPWQCFGAVKR